MNRLESMSVLVAVVDAGSLSAAGRQLNMPLPTVSRKISELEAHVNARLVIRSTRKLTVTEAGRAYIAACKRILQDVAEAERSASGEYSAPQGELTVTAPIVFGRLHVLPVTMEFLKAYPQVDVRLVFADRTFSLVDEHVDVAIRIGELADSSLVGARVGRIRRVVCASPSYLAEHGVPKSPDKLSGHACITFAAPMAADAWTFRSDNSERMIPIHSRLVVNTAEAAVDAAIAGIGLTRVFSYQADAALKAKALALVLTKFEPPPVPVSLLYTGQRLLPQKLRAFLDFSTPLLRVRLQDINQR